MASFTESATLLLRDKSSAKIKKINDELKKLFATSKIILRRQSWYSTQKPGDGAAQGFVTLTDEYGSDGRPLWRSPAAAATRRINALKNCLAVPPFGSAAAGAAHTAALRFA